MSKKISLKDAPKISELINGNSKVKDNQYEKIYHAALLNPDEEIEEPEIVFGVHDKKYGDIKVGTKGNISLFKGQQKSRKTFAVSAIGAVVTGQSTVINFRSYLPGPAKVLYIDTEQGKYDCKMVLQRMVKMSGLDMSKFKSNMKFLTLRPYNPETRREVIRYALDKMGESISLVVIDGIRDLVTDINDSKESTEIVTDLMAWSSDYNVHIMTILHENKSNQNARGHLGTELQNKCESVFRVSKMDQDDNFSVIEAESMRGMSFEPLVFEVQDDDEGLAIPTIAEDIEVVKNEKTGKSKQAKSVDTAVIIDSIPHADHVACIRESFMNAQGLFDNVEPLSARQFNQKIKKAMDNRKYKISDHKARELTDHYLKSKLLTDLNEGQETKIKKLVPGFDDDLPF